MTKKEVSPVNLQERERNLDWLTALTPVLLLGVVYFRWAVLALALVGAAAYMAVAVLLERCGGMTRCVESGLVTGLLVTFCLPATAPLWVSAVACAVAALLSAGVDYVGRRWSSPTAPVCPVLAGYLLVRCVFPAAVSAFPMPTMWASADSVSGATPLAALNAPAIREPIDQLLTGIHPAAIGEGCALILLLAAGYLLLRQRIRLIAPAAMLATVSLFSLLIWDAPLYSLLSGGTVLAALLLADRAYAPRSYVAQALMGMTAGSVTVLVRYLTATDGTAVGVLAACLVGFFWPLFDGWLSKFSPIKFEKFAKTKN